MDEKDEAKLDFSPAPSSFSVPKSAEEPLFLALINGRKEGASKIEKEKAEEAALSLATLYFHLGEGIANGEFRYCDEETRRDLAQEGFLALAACARRFDPTRGVKFSTFAYPYVRKACQNYLKGNRYFVETDEDIASIVPGISPRDEAYQEEKEAAMSLLPTAIDVLSPKQRIAIGYRFGLFGFSELRTFARIGQAMGISDEGARALVHLGITRMKAKMGVK